jgi:uncharacterized protein (DUF362 family)
LNKSERAKAAKTQVAVTRCTDYQAEKIAQVIDKQFSLLGGFDKFISRGDTVLLKPNFIAARPRSEAAQTDPAVILAVAQMVKNFGGRPFVGDSPAWKDVFACIKVLELEEPLRKLGVPVKQLNKPKRCRIAGSSIGISTVALEADKIINLPKLKTHQQLVATFAVKNMFGCVCGKEKAFWHFAKGKSHEEFCRMLIEIYKLLAPAVTIIDAVVAMEGPGPIRGKPKPLGFLIGGTDPVACEMVCCELTDFKVEKLPVIQTARQMEFGCSDMSRIEILGDDYRDFVCADFQLAEQIPVRFSLSHVCKSAVKQLILLARSVRKGT